ncbi:Gluconate transporter [Niastella koreensis GR20-10]|uniref:Gluconate transporter n=1 Tax=Niastella koreensis (strain DSM 17620 / KACC 11465 / NBRC 106392 / GR20-10) TaxID=700598 RepID=G8T704_NIAKG|nr:SLC13 family permease [Niastella koreensis]AEV99025.1 Gluconate transporter [Niastella koreensis GR20-10]
MNLSLFLAEPAVILFTGIIIVAGGIIWLKLNPFLALLLGALVVAIMTPASAVVQYALSKGATQAAALQQANRSVGERVALEFGNTCSKIGIIIAMAAIIGKCLLESGAAERIVRSVLRLTGLQKAPVAFIISSFFVGVPVFFDAVILLMTPLAKTISLRLGKNYLLFILAIAGGAAMANSLVPPAPGPLFLATEMHIAMGTMMIAGIILGLFTITAGYYYAVWVNRKWPVELRDSLDAKLEDIRMVSLQETKQLPPLWLSVLPLLIPLVFICADTAIHSMHDVQPGKLAAVIKFMGDRNIALVIGALIALLILKVHKKQSTAGLSSLVQGAVISAGSLILIISAGGAFGGMLQQTGISERIALWTKDYQMTLIPMAFFITAIVRTAQGSATVALITASGILSGLTHNTSLPYHPLYLGLAIGCGSKLVPWMNDAGFWLICKMSNLTERETLRAFAPMLLVMGLTGLVIIMIAAKLLPLV